MLIKVADKQVLTCPGNAVSQIMSDPIELRQFNRAAAILVVQYYHGDLRFDYWTEVSNDLETWTPEGPSDAFSIAVPPPRQRVGGSAACTDATCARASCSPQAPPAPPAR